MSATTPAEIREHLKGLALANEFEIEELRKAPVELKLRQLWTLMTGAELLTDGARREIEVREVRERWLRLYRALRV